MKIIKKILRILLFARMHIFKYYAYIILAVCCILMNIVGVLGASLRVRLFLCWLWSCLYRLGVLVLLQIYVKVEGRENIDSKNACIYVSKHQSMLETFVFYGLVHRCCFVMKQELLDAPIFGKANRFAEAIAIDRNNGLESMKKVLKEGKDRVEKSLSIVIFPEGTRVNVGEYPKFHRSAMKLASVVDVPIIPVAHNFGRYFGRVKGDIIMPGIARISFEPAISPTGKKVTELTDLCYEIVNAKTKSFKG